MLKSPPALIFLVKYWYIFTLKCAAVRRLSVKRVASQLGHPLACDSLHSQLSALEVLKNLSCFLRYSIFLISWGNHIYFERTISKWCPSTTFKRWKSAFHQWIGLGSFHCTFPPGVRTIQYLLLLRAEWCTHGPGGARSLPVANHRVKGLAPLQQINSSIVQHCIILGSIECLTLNYYSSINCLKKFLFF